ncbi:MAG: S8 family serine peptidase, partial [Rhodocyclales bacterium]|nr:S8 family serine peptidase [Rhodocyclales bacterium]
MAYTGPQPGFNAYNPGKGFTISSGYPFRNGSSVPTHWGVDFAAASGTNIPAAADGVVAYKDYSTTYGNYVVLKHTNSNGAFVYTLYAHMDNPSPLTVGAIVNAGDTVGNVGNSGYTTKNGQQVSVDIHLHMEVRTSPIPNKDGATKTYNPLEYSDWGTGSHIIGTDPSGNPLIAQTSGSLTDGTYVRTVEKHDKTTGAVIGNYVDRVQALNDGAGHLTGYKVSTQDSAGAPLIISTLTTEGNLVRQDTITNGVVTSYTQAGIRVDIGADGQKTAYVSGIDTGIAVAANGDIVVPTASGNITIHLADDSLAGGTCSAGGYTYAFTGGDALGSCANGLLIQGQGAIQATDRLIDGSGQGTQFNYERGNDGAWPDPALSPFQHGADASDGEWNLVSTEPILLAYNGSGTMSDVPVELFTLTTTPDLTATQTSASDPTGAPSTDNSTLISTGTYEVGGVGNVNTATGNTQAANAIASGDLRPGASEVLHFDDWNTGSDAYSSVDGLGAYTNQQATGATQWTPVDPLILDLNGDGVKLTSFAEAPVLFDIDHDGGATKEITGWVSADDGIVVMDLNGNGKIDGIHETMSEYFNGAVGTNGNAGEKKYANGFAALKSLDSNSDNQFTSADTAFTNVKVWTDADHDGVTDSGELKTLTELGITSIALTPTTQSGLVNGGNEILATGTFVRNGSTREAQAARFIANPTGNSFTTSTSGTTVTAEDGQSTYVSSVTTGETIDVAAKNVKNAYGNSGNDTLTGNTAANWLVGGQGSDTFNAGAGDDMLIVDAADLQANIHAGDGFDMVQLVGTEGVTLNLAQAEIEVAVGGAGDDILIGGGRSSVFIRAGDGNDIVIGGAANDALSGENGTDLIDGGAGNDVVRGGRGQDQLMGGAGDDLVEGGLDDDRLSGGTGNDILKGGQGDDAVDGGEGTDIAEFAGSFADYRITRLTDTSYRVVDTKAGRDGADMLANIEKLNFADVSAVDITLDNPLPVKDVLTIADRNGVKLIKVTDLLANDRDWQGDALHLTTLSDLKGGSIAGTYNATTKEWTPTLTANGEIQFTPDAAYTGVMSFKYKIADADNTPGATAYLAGTTTQAEMRGQVFIKTPDMPTDSLFTDEWYLNDINVLPVWRDYTGKGVKIAQFEPGMPFSTGAEVFDYRHPDLQGNVDAAWISDPNTAIPQSFSEHATLVAGVMTAARNSEGAVGVAYDAKLSGHYFTGTGLEADALTQELRNALAQFKHYDVVNNSWGSTANFGLNVVPVGILDQGIDAAVRQGRNGLGTAIVMAGGNDRQNGGNTNANALTANRAVITTGAINAEGDISTLAIGEAPFSNPGASILVSAPGSNVASTSRILMNDDGTVFGSDTLTAQGTSFAAPIVSGVVALMLEANPNLGWRDIQQILAISAKQVSDPDTDTVWNGATNWNGGGMHTSHDYGFGEVDARAAVRLAETWQGQHTSYNERRLSNGEGSMNGGANLNVALGDGATVTRTLSLGAGLRVEHATMSLDLTHSNWGDLTVELISPKKMISELIANPGTSATNPGGDVGTGRLTFALDTTHDYGEDAQGDWELRITDRSGRGTGTLYGWKVDVYGSDLNESAPGLGTATDNNTYFYTDEFATAPGTDRASLSDTNGGSDTINAAAVSTGFVINLTNNAASTVAGRDVTFSGIENTIGGDGNDSITGNSSDNLLIGGRGDDTLYGGSGTDTLIGGPGNNLLRGDSPSDMNTRAD